jgi:hypothetical protein
MELFIFIEHLLSRCLSYRYHIKQEPIFCQSCALDHIIPSYY